MNLNEERSTGQEDNKESDYYMEGLRLSSIEQVQSIDGIDILSHVLVHEAFICD